MLDFAFLRERTIEDALSGEVRLTIGGQGYTLPALPIRPNREWLTNLDSGLAALLSALDQAGDDVATIMAALSGATDDLVEALVAYDAQKVLPPRDELEERMTPGELLRAILQCWSAANPLAAIGAGTMVPTNSPANVSPLPTSTRRRRGATRSTTSKAS